MFYGIEIVEFMPLRVCITCFFFSFASSSSVCDVCVLCVAAVPVLFNVCSHNNKCYKYRERLVVMSCYNKKKEKKKHTQKNRSIEVKNAAQIVV